MRVSSTDIQNAFGKYLALAEKEDIIVVKNGKCVAKLSRYTEPDFYIHEEAKRYPSLQKITYEEYLALVESSDQRYELIDGDVYLLASPSFQHQVVVNEILWLFNNYFKKTSCQSLTSPLDIRLFGFATKFEEDPNVVQPDIVVVCDQEKVRGTKYEGVPTLIVEVLSPSTKGKDMAVKLQLYLKSGVSEYWLVDIEEKNVIQYAFTQDRDIDSVTACAEEDTIQSRIFAGLQLPVSAIFAGLTK